LNVVSISDKKEHWKEAFIHPKSSMNLVTQLAEWNPRLAKEKGIGWDISWNGYKDYNDVRAFKLPLQYYNGRWHSVSDDAPSAAASNAQ
jgi:hypothetical protein